MLVTSEANRRNRMAAAILAGSVIAFSIAAGFWNEWCWLGIPFSALLYWLLRRPTLRRIEVMQTAFPAEWEQGLRSHVEFFRALDDSQQARFRNLVKVFLDEVPITGVRTDVDELTRVLVAASAVIPIFGFDDWEYRGLGEVLIYPNRFDANFQSDDLADRDTLGMIGVNQLSGVMILSKPDLIAGFANSQDKRNVGFHEFAHLVDKADGTVDGIPVGIPGDVVRPWIDWVGSELNKPRERGRIDGYAYTNQAEYFAVLSEYFFESPELMAEKDPQMYRMMQSMYRQDTSELFNALPRRPKRIGRNSPCPCGSKKKYKRCCRSRRKKGLPRTWHR